MCKNYDPTMQLLVITAFALGDPHITTLDGKTYTFNGRGEYILVKALETGFMFQGRTEPVSDTSNATQFSAFAMGIPEQGLSAEVLSAACLFLKYIQFSVYLLVQ